MIHSAVIRLTLWYLAIIMALSIGFSIALYSISSREINRGLRQQPVYYSGQFPPSNLVIETFRQQQIQESLRHLRANLVLLNLATLAVGGAAGYLLARRTLGPIAKAMDAQSRFAADASHELRTPLTAMQTENEVALRNPKLTKDQAKELLESNLEEVAKLKGLSEGLLRLAQADSKDLPMRRVEVKKLVEAAKGRIAKQAALRNITIKTTLADAHLQGDFESLIELLYILLDNAVKYSAEKSEVRIQAKKSNKLIVISVADTGRGIADKDLPHIFERFYRSDMSRTRTSAGGYGLGLSIAAKIAHLHGGRIDATSELNKGSVFTVYLPVKKD